jgi:5'-nucleotidase
LSPGQPKPCILITNDDGYDAPGIRALALAMSGLGDVVVAAPDTEQSASSHSLTLKRPLRVVRVEEGQYRIDGTPTDCVHLAVPRLTGGKLPDLVVSGINRGLNVGDDVTYSGTVAGALEGTLLHVPSLAVSAAVDERGDADYGTAAGIAVRMAKTVLSRGLDPGVLLNVNVPAGEPKGLRVTRQGTRSYRATALEREDPSGRPYFWIARADTTPTGEPDGDHAAIRDGYISVCPLQANLTHEASLSTLASWNLEGS